MYKAICNLVTEGLHFNVGEKYSEKEISTISKVLISMCFKEVEAEAQAEAPAEKESTGDEDVSNSDLKVDELKEALTNLGIEIPENAKKADLVALLDKAQA